MIVCDIRTTENIGRDNPCLVLRNDIADSNFSLVICASRTSQALAVWDSSLLRKGPSQRRRKADRLDSNINVQMSVLFTGCLSACGSFCTLTVRGLTYAFSNAAAGSVLIALVPASQPSTVVLWELLPQTAHTQPPPPASGTSSLSPLIATLLRTPRPNESKSETPLSATIVSSFSVEEGGDHTRRVAGMTFEGGPSGEGLVVVTTGVDGDDLASLERWRSSAEPLEVHEVFRSGKDVKEGQETVVKWSRTAVAELPIGREAVLGEVGLRFSSTGDQLAVRTAERTHLFHFRWACNSILGVFGDHYSGPQVRLDFTVFKVES